MVSPVAKRELLIQPFCEVKPQSFKKFRLQRHCKRSMSAEITKAILKLYSSVPTPKKQNNNWTIQGFAIALVISKN